MSLPTMMTAFEKATQKRMQDPAVLDPQLLAYLFLVEANYDLSVYNGSRRRLRVDLDHLLHSVKIGTNILFYEMDDSLR
jgi:hypothetical protein